MADVSQDLMDSLIQVESKGRNIPSYKGDAVATGPAQVSPAAAKDVGVDPSTLHDPKVNVATGKDYLGKLIDKYEGNIKKALAAYNWGPTNVDKFGEDKAPAETHKYVNDVQSGYMNRIAAKLKPPSKDIISTAEAAPTVTPETAMATKPEGPSPELKAKVEAYKKQQNSHSSDEFQPYATPKTPTMRSLEMSHRGADLPGAIKYASEGKDPGVDYSGVDDVKHQAVYSLLDTPEERTAYLKKEYGEKNVTKSSYGEDVIIQNGKKVAFKPREGFFEAISSGGERGLEHPKFARNVAALAGDVPEIAGMVAGGITGGIPGAAAGAAGGAAIKHGIKHTLGLNQQPLEEEAIDVAKAGMGGAIAEVGGRVLMKVGRTLLAPYEKGSILGPWSSTLPQYLKQKEDVDLAQKWGFTPENKAPLSPKVYAPRATFVNAIASLGQYVFGDANAVGVKEHVGRYVSKYIKEANPTGVSLGGAGEIAPTSAIKAGLNLDVSNAADTVINKAEADAGKALLKATDILEASRERITAKVGGPSPTLSQSISDDIWASRKAFSEQANALYAPVDEYAGKAIVPTSGLKKATQDIISKRATTVEGKAVGAAMPMLDRILQMPNKISFVQMQDLRHELGSMTEAEALNAGVSAGRAKVLASEADLSFTQAVKNMEKQVGPAGAKNVKKTVDALRFADDFYKKGIQRFDNFTVKGLVKDASQGGHVAPERITEYLVKPEQVARLLAVQKVVTPETWAQVGGAHWNRILEKATNPVTGEVSGKSLAKALSGKENDIVFGKSIGEMRKYSRQLAVMNGQADLGLLNTGAVGQAIRTAAEKQQALTKLVNERGVIGAIRTGGPESLTAADMVTDPGMKSLAKWRELKGALGTSAPELGQLREYTARKIFSQMITPASSGANKYGIDTELSGKALQKALSQYDQSHLIEIMGKDWVKNVNEFAKAAEIGTRTLSDVPGLGIVAGAGMKIAPLHHKMGLAKLWLTNELWSRPTVIKYLSGGFEHGDIIDRVRNMGEIATRVGIPYEVTEKPKQAAESWRGIQEHITNKGIVNEIPTH